MATEKEFVMKKMKCLRCGHEWYKRRPEKPRICPKCKSADWNVEKKNASSWKDEVYSEIGKLKKSQGK